VSLNYRLSANDGYPACARLAAVNLQRSFRGGNLTERQFGIAAAHTVQIAVIQRFTSPAEKSGVAGA